VENKGGISGDDKSELISTRARSKVSDVKDLRGPCGKERPARPAFNYLAIMRRVRVSSCCAIAQIPVLTTVDVRSATSSVPVGATRLSLVRPPHGEDASGKGDREADVMAERNI
jgi:hypothetical protein